MEGFKVDDFGERCFGDSFNLRVSNSPLLTPRGDMGEMSQFLTSASVFLGLAESLLGDECLFFGDVLRYDGEDGADEEALPTPFIIGLYDCDVAVSFVPDLIGRVFAPLSNTLTALDAPPMEWSVSEIVARCSQYSGRREVK